MKPRNFSRRGSAMMAALLLTLIASVGVASLLKYSGHSARTTRRSLDYQRARVAAEAGLDYGVRELQKLVLTWQFAKSKDGMQYLVDQIELPPDLSGYEYVSPSGEDSFRITVDTEPTTGEIPDGNVGKGEFGEYQQYTITCGARNPSTGVGAVLTQRVQVTSLFIMRFGVFYWYDLEINPGPTMYFDGPIHGNHDIYLTGRLDIQAPVTSHGAIYHDRKDKKNANRGQTTIHNTKGEGVNLMQDGDVVDSSSDTWVTDALNHFEGNAQSASHGVPLLTPPINELDEPYEIIRRPSELPPDDPDYRQETEDEKFSNKAALYIHVHEDGTFEAKVHKNTFKEEDVTDRFSRAQLKESDDANGHYVKTGTGEYKMDSDGSFDIDRRFLDSRENVTVAPVDIYIDQLAKEFPELTEGNSISVKDGRGVVYVTRDAPKGEGNVMPAVRLRNGSKMPTGGLTVATDLPMYVEGNYNTEGDTRQPSLVTADSVTFLSNHWQDERSTDDLNDRVAVDTEFNTVVMTGNSETIAGGTYNGGLENVLRFMEHWSGKTVKYRGSIIDLWYSQKTNAPWTYGNYYTAPKRDWEFDPVLRNNAPPGVTRVFGVEMLTWRVSTWSEQGWQ